MNRWTLELKHTVEGVKDASPIEIQRFASLDKKAIESIAICVDGTDVPLGDLFSLTVDEGPTARLCVRGNLSQFQRLAANHCAGEFVIDGDAGDYVGTSLRGGHVRVLGNVGDHLAAVSGAAKVGADRGRIEVSGNAGDFVGHRMRRGEVFVAGNVGRFAASHLIAGTIVIAGSLGDNPVYAMRRGTLIANRLPELPAEQFTEPLTQEFLFASLISGITLAQCEALCQKIRDSGCVSRRGDRAVGGQGEILAPAK